jgi:hypothetical protein
MLLSNIFFFATAVLAAPAVLSPAAPIEARSLEVRQEKATVGSAVLQAALTLESTVNTSIQEINKAVASIKANTEASVVVALQATIRSNIQAIVKAFQDATATILATIGGSLSAIINLATGLSQEQINNLIEAVAVIQRVLANIRVLVTVTVSSAGPSTVAFVNAELNTLKNALEPFLTPLVTYLTAVRNLSASATVTVQGLSSSLAELTNYVQTLAKSLGLNTLLGPILTSVGSLLSLLGVRP